MNLGHNSLPLPEPPDLTIQCEDGKHWLCEDEIDCSCPCHDDMEDDDGD